MYPRSPKSVIVVCMMPPVTSGREYAFRTTAAETKAPTPISSGENASSTTTGAKRSLNSESDNCASRRD
ncbi:hypothetical protein PspLS_05663 [Pyricularia sp. CBS 133598]|nr:hypothetical protein PspLS_05663 [Pyricularia sp. CBS 133598]